MSNFLRRIGNRLQRAYHQLLCALEDASLIISDAYRVLDAQYRGEVQPLFRFITNSPVSFSLLVVLFIVTIVALFAAFAAFKFIIYSMFLGIGMVL